MEFARKEMERIVANQMVKTAAERGAKQLELLNIPPGD